MPEELPGMMHDGEKLMSRAVAQAKKPTNKSSQVKSSTVLGLRTRVASIRTDPSSLTRALGLVGGPVEVS